MTVSGSRLRFNAFPYSYDAATDTFTGLDVGKVRWPGGYDRDIKYISGVGVMVSAGVPRCANLDMTESDGNNWPSVCELIPAPNGQPGALPDAAAIKCDGI